MLDRRERVASMTSLEELALPAPSSAASVAEGMTYSLPWHLSQKSKVKKSEKRIATLFFPP